MCCKRIFIHDHPSRYRRILPHPPHVSSRRPPPPPNLSPHLPSGPPTNPAGKRAGLLTGGRPSTKQKHIRQSASRDDEHQSISLPSTAFLSICLSSRQHPSNVVVPLSDCLSVCLNSTDATHIICSRLRLRQHGKAFSDVCVSTPGSYRDASIVQLRTKLGKRRLNIATRKQSQNTQCFPSRQLKTFLFHNTTSY